MGDHEEVKEQSWWFIPPFSNPWKPEPQNLKFKLHVRGDYEPNPIGWNTRNRFGILTVNRDAILTDQWREGAD